MTPDQERDEMKKLLTAEAFSVNLRQLLRDLDMNQTEFAELIGITQAGASQILNGERTPSVETILKILNNIPVKFERLFRQ